MKPVNLIPQDQRRRFAADGNAKGAPILLGVLAALLALVVVYVLTANTVTERKGEANTARAEADQIEVQADQQNSFTDFAQVALTRTQSVAGVASTRFDWERFMRELSRVMPAGSWLQSADASVLGDPTSGGGTAPTAEATTVVTPAANLVGCTPGQDDVARMMVRLRQLYRVDDVELNESTAGTRADEASVDSCGALYTFNLTVNFSATGPSSETPRGSKSVPASLGGGS
ncbi:MAG: PilN domain-containing protein [Thermoleophilaceae bacterium]|nr:PilN domain-containing protein [Thermoleophilaceae bacterium]